MPRDRYLPSDGFADVLLLLASVTLVIALVCVLVALGATTGDGPTAAAASSTAGAVLLIFLANIYKAVREIEKQGIARDERERDATRARQSRESEAANP